MSKKHFERFAQMLRMVENPKLRKEMAKELVVVFKEFNANFDKERFLVAANCDK